MKKLFTFLATALVGAASAFPAAPSLVWFTPEFPNPDWELGSRPSVGWIYTYWDTDGDPFTINPDAVGTLYRNGFAIGEVKFMSSDEPGLDGNTAMIIDPPFTLSTWNYTIRIPAGTIVTSSGETNKEERIEYNFRSLDPEGFTQPTDELVPLYEVASINLGPGGTVSETLSITWDIKGMEDIYGNVYTPETVYFTGSHIYLSTNLPNAKESKWYLKTDGGGYEIPVRNGQVSVGYWLCDENFDDGLDFLAYGDVTVNVGPGVFYDKTTFATNKGVSFDCRLDHGWTPSISFPDEHFLEITPFECDHSTIDGNITPLEEIRIRFKDVYYYNYKTPKRMEVPEGRTLELSIWDDDACFESDPISCEWESDDCVTIIIPFKTNPLTKNGDYYLNIPYGFIKPQGPESHDVHVEFTYIAPETPIEPIEPDPVEPEDPDHVRLSADIAGHGLVIASVAKAKPVEIHLTPAEGWTIDRVLLDEEALAAEETEGSYILPALDKAATLHVSYAYDPDVQIVDGTTGVTDIAGSDYRIGIEGGRAVITGLAGGELIKLYTLHGALVDTLTATSDTVTVTLRPGAHIITIDDRHAVKVIL